MPLSELDNYATVLRSLSQGRAVYDAEFGDYAPVPKSIQHDLHEAYVHHDEAED